MMTSRLCMWLAVLLFAVSNGESREAKGPFNKLNMGEMNEDNDNDSIDFDQMAFTSTEDLSFNEDDSIDTKKSKLIKLVERSWKKANKTHSWKRYRIIRRYKIDEEYY